MSHLGEYSAASVEVVRPLRLIKLADEGLGVLGIDLRVTGGDDYDLSQRWATAIHSNTANLDGILYPSRHHNQLYSVALFERASDAVAFRPWGRLADSACADLWIKTAEFLRRFKIDLLDESDKSSSKQDG